MPPTNNCISVHRGPKLESLSAKNDNTKNNDATILRQNKGGSKFEDLSEEKDEIINKEAFVGGKEIKPEELLIDREKPMQEVREVVKIGTDFSYTNKIDWKSVVITAAIHVGGLVGLHLCLTGHVLKSTIVWSIFYAYIGCEGAHLAAHRYFAHKSFKAKTPLKIGLLIIQTVAGMNSAYVWAQDHRQHHRFSDTDADPHNATRGFWYSHWGWLVTKRNPLFKKMRKTIDVRDLQQDKLIMFQYKYFLPLYFVVGFALPIFVPVYFFNESLLNALFVSYFLRYMYTLNLTFCINSVSHKYGKRPYDRNIKPADNWLFSLMSLGEGWHNYHHAFPWDYKGGEICMPFQGTTNMIHFFARIGQIYDLKTVSPEMLQNKVKRSGDGTRSW